MKGVKHDFKKRYDEHEKKYIESCEQLEKENFAKEEMLHADYQNKLVETEKKFEERLFRLKEELDLKLKVEVH